MKRRRSHVILLCMVSALIWLSGISACGKKDDPMPPDVKPPEAVRNLAARKAGEAIRLTWAMDGGEAVKDIRIQRSELETLRGDCPECPRDYKEIASFLAGDPKLVREGREIRFDDDQVKAGRLYTYRVVVCDLRGVCSEPSDPAELKF